MSQSDPQRPKRRPAIYLGKKEIKKILKERGAELNGISAIARHCDRWKALFFTSCIPTDRRGTTK